MVYKGGAKAIQEYRVSRIKSDGDDGGKRACAAVFQARACVRPYPFVHLRIGRRFMGISSALWIVGGRAVCAPVHETQPQARPPPRSGGEDCGGIAEGDGGEIKGVREKER